MDIRQICTSLMSPFLMAALLAAGPLLAQDEPDPVVESATPSSAPQGTLDLDVQIVGSYLGRGAEVTFHEAMAGEGVFGPEITDIKVKNVKAMGTTRLVVTLDIGDNAYVGDTDIKVSYTTQNTSRKGKGTTLFKVLEKETTQPSDCMLDFDATLDDLYDDVAGRWIDGLRSDKEYDINANLVTDMDPYYAFGGTGMRLDTNGSQKLENSNDTRFFTIDFSRTSEGCFLGNENNPAGAAGFCTATKGVDLRFEHQVQVLQDNGLCLMPVGGTMNISIRVAFQQSNGGTMTNEFKNGRQNGNGTTTLSLSYGCQAPNLLQGDYRAEDRALVTRVDEYMWTVVGQKACMHTNLGNKLVDTDKKTMYLNMPFGLTLIDRKAPPNN